MQQPGERKTMASAPFLELLGLRSRAGGGEGAGGKGQGGVDDDDYGKRSYFPPFFGPLPLATLL